MHHHLLLKIIALFDSQYCRGRWLRFFTVDDPAYPLLSNSAPSFLQFFTKHIAKQPKLFFFAVHFQRRKPHSKLLYETYKKAAEG